ncbi:MAG: PhzF family phenazine biosynthesis protein [Mycobacteriales bacterium]
MVPGLEYRILDVFTDRPFAGNPLAVVFGAEALPTSALAALAREFNLSETAFPMPPAGRGDYRVRIFTPQTELPFAGHPSVGTAWALVDRAVLAAGEVVQECGAGLLRLVVSPQGGSVRLYGAVARSRPITSAALVVRAAGLGEEHLLGRLPVLAGAGLDFAYLAVAASALDQLVPQPRELQQLSDELGCAGLAVVHPTEGLVRARVLAGGVGVAEDPATGSAALGLGAALLAWGLAPADGNYRYRVEQGDQIGRPSLMECSLTSSRGEVTEVSVAGNVVAVAEGRIRVP